MSSALNIPLFSQMEEQMLCKSHTSVIQNLFFIYPYKEKVDGPFDIDEIVRLYVTKQIGSMTEKLWIKKASDEDDEKYWIEYDIIKSQSCNGEEFEITQSLNGDKSHAKLYSELKLNENKRIMNEIPFNIPKGALSDTTSCINKLLNLFGKYFVVLSINFIIGVHIFTTVTIILCIWGFWMRVLKRNSTQGIYPKWIAFMYSGFIIVPITVIALFNVRKIETWKVMYITWGVSAFLFSFLILWKILSNTKPSDKHQSCMKKCIKKCNLKCILNIILFITGVNFDGITLEKVGKEHIKFYLQLIFIFPSLAALFPSIIIGYVTNFILQEKFELQCSDEIMNTDICTADGHGCCEIISSWNYRYMFEFVGGLISSIIFTWGLIRFIGFLVASASPRIALFLQRN